MEEQSVDKGLVKSKIPMSLGPCAAPQGNSRMQGELSGINVGEATTLLVA